MDQEKQGAVITESTSNDQTHYKREFDLALSTLISVLMFRFIISGFSGNPVV